MSFEIFNLMFNQHKRIYVMLN